MLQGIGCHAIGDGRATGRACFRAHQIEFQTGKYFGTAVGLLLSRGSDAVGAGLDPRRVRIPDRLFVRKCVHRVVAFPVENDKRFARVAWIGEQGFAEAREFSSCRIVFVQREAIVLTALQIAGGICGQ